LEKAKGGVDKSNSIQKLLSENKNGVDIMVQGILQSAEESKLNLQKIKELELLSRKIDKIVDAITMVSVQTNMLAVSGAIEAARAGEFGKGFAVVASDIRNLAHDSATNADKIKDMVKAIQDQVNIVMRDIEEIMNSAIEETEKAKIATEGLNAVEKDMQEVKSGSEEIVKLAEEIVVAIGQAKKAVEQIAAAAQEAEKAAAEAAAAAKQQSQGAEELAAGIEEIASLADELQSAV